MAKMIVFWLLIVLSVAFFVGGGLWLFFWAHKRAKDQSIIPPDEDL